MTNQQFDPALFRATLDSLRPATLATLIDHVDTGMPFAAMNPWSRAALEKRGILNPLLEAIKISNGTDFPPIVYDRLTDYGRVFVAWYRQSRDLPVTMDMFGDEQVGGA